MLGARTIQKIRTWFFGKFVGMDLFGNRYYQSQKLKDSFGRSRRWVDYAGLIEATKVPASWHGWLHYTNDTPGTEQPLAQSWQRPHLPNASGTVYAYTPSYCRKTLLGVEAKPDYVAWKPEN